MFLRRKRAFANERYCEELALDMHARMMMLTRKQFLRSLAGLGAGVVVLGCSSDDGTPVDASPNMPTMDATRGTPDAPPVDAPPGMACAATMATIGTNHGHTASVSAADVTAGVEKTYDIQGTSGHPHTVTITAAMFAMLRAGQQVVATSSNDAGHTHSVTIKCV